jgi:protoheme IX farnesyltransferase|tara:strand:+ start:1599 stop:2510 length:912 start_codon:yes stop_codon:yes gene_type:complete
LSNTYSKTRGIKIENFQYLKALYELMKPRVMSLSIFTCVAGLLIAPIQTDHLSAIISILAVALGSGAAGALNCWYESDVDSLMSRTCLRPIPTGRLTRREALIFGTISSFISIGVLYFFSNIVAASLLALTISFYVFVYTIWLKRKTPQNIVIGGAAGALPPVIGWSIATGSISIEPIILFLIIFIWTPSHFWALSLFKSDDYKKAKIPMLPVTSGIPTTKKNILLYSILLFPFALAPFYLGFSGLIYLFFSFPLSAYYIFICFKLYKEKNNKLEKVIAKQIFAFSILYLFAIFILILVDKFA